jgi:hypothetical protein
VTEPTQGDDPNLDVPDPWAPPVRDPFAPPPSDPVAPPPGDPVAPPPAAAPPGWSAPPAGSAPDPSAGPAYGWGAVPGQPQGWAVAPSPSYGWGSGAPEEPRTTNPWAIVALVTGLLALVPVAIGAGITALVQIHRRRQAGMGMAIAGIVGAAVWTLVAVVVGVVLLVNFGDPGGGALGRVADAASTDVGSCLRAPGGDASLATVADCAGKHDGEVYSVDTLGGTAWPGYDQTDSDADDLCYGGFAAYVGRSFEDSEYDYGYFLPDQAEWAAGERRVVCVVLTSSAETSRGRARGRDR